MRWLNDVTDGDVPEESQVLVRPKRSFVACFEVVLPIVQIFCIFPI